MAVFLYERPNYDEYDFIMHHGAKGQKWGRRLYQYSDGSLTPLGRAHYGVGKAREYITNKHEEHVGKRIEKAKEKGNADVLYKYRDRFSTKELNDIVNRNQAISNLKRQTSSAQEHDAILDIVNRHMGRVNTFTSNVNSITKNLYSTAERLNGTGNQSKKNKKSETSEETKSQNKDKNGNSGQKKESKTSEKMSSLLSEDLNNSESAAIDRGRKYLEQKFSGNKPKSGTTAEERQKLGRQIVSSVKRDQRRVAGRQFVEDLFHSPSYMGNRFVEEKKR